MIPKIVWINNDVLNSKFPMYFFVYLLDEGKNIGIGRKKVSSNVDVTHHAVLRHVKIFLFPGVYTVSVGTVLSPRLRQNAGSDLRVPNAIFHDFSIVMRNFSHNSKMFALKSNSIYLETKRT